MSGKEKGVLNAIVNIKFEENLTWISCSKMVIEIIKYLAYQKQQIPYPFEQLKLLVNKKNSDRGDAGSTNKSLQSGRYHRKAVEAVETLESIFQNIEAEFMVSSQDCLGGVEEVLVLFGATPVTPKDVFRIQIPDIKSDFDFETPKPASRMMMIQLLRCLLESESLHSIVSQPLTTTNTFIFFKRKFNHFKAPETLVNKSWFLPRENFKLPQKGRQAVLRLEYVSKELMTTEAESPLARPLLEISDSECTPMKDEYSRDQLCLPLMKTEDLRQKSQCGREKIIKIPGGKLANHLVFKAPISVEEGLPKSFPASGRGSNSYGEVKCLVGNVSDSIHRLSDDFEKISFKPRMESNRTSSNISIEWFEARAPIRGFKDYVVNGVSAIAS